MQRGTNALMRPLSVTTSTWRRESHGLYDYENRQVVRTTLAVRGSGRVVRVGDDCTFVSDASSQPPNVDEKVLAVIEQEYDQYIVTPEEEPHWLILSRERIGNGWKLTEGDVVKLGRVRFRVKEIYSPFLAQQTNLSMDQHQRASQSPSKSDFSPAVMTAQSPCRICLFETYTKANPLMTPCKCSGTMRYIHLECLQQWLGSKMTMRQSGNIVSYSWKQLDCELCKEAFPLVVSLDGRVVDLVEMHKPDTPYLVLEDERVENGRGKGLHVLSLPENSYVRMGRGHESDLRISDISVSRGHAVIQLTREGFFIADNHSKFGTLLLVRRPIRIVDELPVALQVNRTVLTLQLAQSFRLIRSCFAFMFCCRGSAAVADVTQRQYSLGVPKEEHPAVIPLAEAVSPSEPAIESESMLPNSHHPRHSSGLLGETAHIEENQESAAERDLLPPESVERLDTRGHQRGEGSEETLRQE